ncbi:hypothetical protein [Hymenobacter metallicola]|uniref:Uncharacterized protein n=1 Tax=Hymenobacter metallicola TaxID=2563114 RepID=A0A4Z0PVX9_9BACT|nr:hypothetical protein [Hymenobacter metallicola]TGE21013.1 hypothetical protein E5K02_24945 [Hymenobacter metallicola]
MHDLQRVRSWVEAGKQVGKCFTFVRNGVTYRSSVAVQKWKDGYKLYVDEIEEEYIQSEAYEREQVIFKCSLSELEVLIKDTTSLTIEQLAPLKGQKLFNPAFD